VSLLFAVELWGLEILFKGEKGERRELFKTKEGILQTFPLFAAL